MIQAKIFHTKTKYRVGCAGTVHIIRHVLKNEFISEAKINVVFINDKTMREMNKTYLHHMSTTDVLSFSFNENQRKLEGEVYINLEQVRRQARDYHVTIKEESARIIIHGILHLVGYRDKAKRQREEMTGLENLYLAQIFHKSDFRL